MEKSLFIEFMGDSPTVRVLDYLLTERGLDLNNRYGKKCRYWKNNIIQDLGQFN